MTAIDIPPRPVVLVNLQANLQTSLSTFVVGGVALEVFFLPRSPPRIAGEGTMEKQGPRQTGPGVIAKGSSGRK